MAKTKEISLPHFQSIFESLGVIFNKQKNDERVADCPFCGKQNHFSLNISNGLWQCWKCGAGNPGINNHAPKGNLFGFLRAYYEDSLKYTTEQDLVNLAVYRQLPVSIFKEHKVAFDGEEYIFPVVNNFKKICNLLRYKIGKKPYWLEDLKTYPLGIEHLFDSNRLTEPVYLCEGPTDWLALSWLLKINNIPGIPICLAGARVLQDWQKDYFRNRIIICCFDNDKDGYSGGERNYNLLKDYIIDFKLIKWPTEFSPGYDVNEFVTAYGVATKTPKDCWDKFSGLIQPLVNNQIQAQKVELEKHISSNLSLIELFDTYSKVIDLDNDIISAIKLSLSIVLSNNLPAKKNPVWMFLVGPPGYGKSEVICSFAEAKNLCHYESTLKRTTLISGFKTPSGVDSSIIPLLDNKTLCLKDYTEVLDAQSQDQKDVYKTLRGGFDGEVDFTFGNGVRRSYRSRFSIIAGVTHNIRKYSQASVGERFLRFIMDVKNVDWEAQQKKALETDLFGGKDKNILLISVKKFLEKKFDFSEERIHTIVNNEFTNKISHLAKLAAQLRTTVDRHEQGLKFGQLAFEPIAEAGNRLYIQLSKSAISMAILEGKDTITEPIYELIKRLAFDTVFSFQTRILNFLFKEQKSYTIQEMALANSISRNCVSNCVDDLQELGYIERNEMVRVVNNMVQSYRITNKLSELWKHI